jgi:hypothetical protein
MMMIVEEKGRRERSGELKGEKASRRDFLTFVILRVGFLVWQLALS